MLIDSAFGKGEFYDCPKGATFPDLRRKKTIKGVEVVSDL